MSPGSYFHAKWPRKQRAHSVECVFVHVSKHNCHSYNQACCPAWKPSHVGQRNYCFLDQSHGQLQMCHWVNPSQARNGPWWNRVSHGVRGQVPDGASHPFTRLHIKKKTVCANLASSWRLASPRATAYHCGGIVGGHEALWIMLSVCVLESSVCACTCACTCVSVC